MKKIFILLMLVLSIQSICFAEDIYIGDNDGMATYLRTESIQVNMKVVTGVANAVNTVTYQTIELPNMKRLEEIKILCLDNNITHRERNYKVLLNYNRVKKEWREEVPVVNIEKSTWKESSGKYTYDQSILVNKVCYLNSDEPKNAIYINTFKEVLKYYNDHKEIGKVTYSD